MKLLICTQVIDTEHPILGFFHRWVEEFALYFEEVHVICLREGAHKLPENVFVYSLGKESGENRVKYLWRFYRYAFSLRKKYDVVFVHMVPQYFFLMGVLWRLWRKKTMLWFSHRSVTTWLRVANLLTHHIFSTSSHAMRLRSKKVHFVGHGIDLRAFTLSLPPKEPVRIMYLGRIAPIKRIEFMIDACVALRKRGASVVFDIVGDLDLVQLADYKDMLQKRVPSEYREYVTFRGSIAHDELPQVLKDAHVLYNFSPTGGMDKSVLEAMAMGIPPVVSNEAFVEILGEHSDLYVSDVEAIDKLADATLHAVELSTDERARVYLRERIRDTASLGKLIPTILEHV